MWQIIKDIIFEDVRRTMRRVFRRPQPDSPFPTQRTGSEPTGESDTP